MKSHAKRIAVLQQLIITLRGLRLSADTELAEEAVKEERQMQREIDRLEELQRQPELMPHAA